ncbi:MAG TPA: DUF1330 domain-containing protein [Candidatus Binatia bacterium]|jgi:uncharacterized protein (DUF1330 family)|nr:DUF1330 domain-containing protein [Candidatus Binatia bacterium]
MSAIFPNLEQFQELAQSRDTGPVVMINLAAFRSGGGAGGAAFARWAERAVPMVESVGGKLLFAGRGDQVLVGDAAESWDVVALTWYPSRRAFLEMVTGPAYRAVNEDRERALERTLMVACTPMIDDLSRKD